MNPTAFLQSPNFAFYESPTRSARNTTALLPPTLQAKILTLVKQHQGMFAIDITNGGVETPPGPGSGPKPKPSYYGSIGYQLNQRRRWLARDHSDITNWSYTSPPLTGGVSLDVTTVHQGPGKRPVVTGQPISLHGNFNGSSQLTSMVPVGVSHFYNMNNPTGADEWHPDVSGLFAFPVDATTVTSAYGALSDSFRDDTQQTLLSNEYTIEQALGDGLAVVSGWNFSAMQWGESDTRKLDEFVQRATAVDLDHDPGGTTGAPVIINPAEVPGVLSNNILGGSVNFNPPPPPSGFSANMLAFSSHWYEELAFGSGATGVKPLILRRSQLKCSRALPYFIASAVIQLQTSPSTSDFESILNLALISRGVTTPNQSLEIPFPSLGTRLTLYPGQSNEQLSIGAINFLILGESTAQYSARTGLAIAGA